MFKRLIVCCFELWVLVNIVIESLIMAKKQKMLNSKISIHVSLYLHIVNTPSIFVPCVHRTIFIYMAAQRNRLANTH